MPEIKHNFTGGKMNKDLDERLVQNGEYRDAMNIQVTTSEGSSVGTVQNILGNSEVSGQDFIGNNAVCVASVSDERNDTLYWFTHESTEILQNNSPITDTNKWITTNNGGISEDFSGEGVYLKTDPNVGTKKYAGWGQVFELEDGATYHLSVEFNENNNGGTNNDTTFFVGGVSWRGGDNFYRPVSTKNVTNGRHDYRFTFENSKNRGFDQTTGLPDPPSNYMRFWMELVDADTRVKSVRVLNISLVKIEKDRILKYDTKSQTISPVFVDVDNHYLLQFHPNRIITGINLIDDMLFWTDNFSEPKKINIPQCIDGTSQSGDITTKLHNKSTGVIQNMKEDYLTVIKQAPKQALIYNIDTGRDQNKVQSAIMSTSSEDNALHDFIDVSKSKGRYDFRGLNTNGIENPVDFDNAFVDIELPQSYKNQTTFTLDGWEEGKKVVLKEADLDDGELPNIPISKYRIKGHLATGYNHKFDATPGNPAKVRIVIDSISGNPPSINSGTLSYVVDLFDEDKKLFETKFPRFSYRYKYIDGQYSTFAPWTTPIFVPGNFEFHPTKGYNLGMTNNIKSLVLKGFSSSTTPKDVISVDILYKEDVSPNVYIVESLSKLDQKINNNNPWILNEYEIQRDTILAALPSNQILRSWDNVPRMALAQDIVGNRLVYGNYKQGYNLSVGRSSNVIQITPNFKVAITSNNYEVKSIKSLREYQLGVVFTDKYGRETPVVTSKSGDFTIDKSQASNSNKIKVGFKGGEIPEHLEYFKFFIKDTSGEYYNLVMDTWYPAEDGNVWLSFPSSERNKINEETFLILKKKADANESVVDDVKYRVLEIESNAPNFIKTEQVKIGQRSQGDDTANLLFEGSEDIPLIDGSTFTINSNRISGTSLAKIDEIDDDIYIDISFERTNQVSQKYKVSQVVKDGDYYFTIDNSFEEDISFIFQGDTTSPTHVSSRTRIRFYREITKDTARYEGRFFVKIYKDDNFIKNISANSELPWDQAKEYKSAVRMKLHYLPRVQTLNSRHVQASARIFSRNNVESYNSYFDALSNIGKPNGDYYNYWDDGGDGNNPGGKQQKQGLAFSRLPYNNGTQGFTNIIQNGARSGYYGVWRAWFKNGISNLWEKDHSARSGNPNRGNFYAYLDADSSSGRMWDSWAWRKKYKLTDLAMSIMHDDALNADHYEDTHSKGGEFENLVFIDAGTSMAKHPSSDWFWYSNSEFHPGALHGITEEIGIYENDDGTGGSMSVGVGPIAPENNPSDPALNEWVWKKEDGKSPEDSIFYDIANQSRTKYAKIAPFWKRIATGQKFRWAEDPNGTIYTITGAQTYRNLIRHTRQSYGQATPYENPYYFDSCNYTANIRFNFAPAMKDWNPIVSELSTDTGVIDGTREINQYVSDYTTTPTTKASLTAHSWGSDHVIIAGDQFRSSYDVSKNEEAPITVGMALVAIASSNVNSGKGVLIKQIEHDTANDRYKFIFEGYNKTQQATLSGTGQLHFKQVTMHGISPNSAKNINHYNSNVSNFIGIGSVGYTMEFLDPVDEENELPSNPAVWETEAKPTGDLDIYYEISGNNAIYLSPQTKDIAAPIGSKIKSLEIGNIFSNDIEITNIQFVEGGNPIITLSEEYHILPAYFPIPIPFTYAQLGFSAGQQIPMVTVPGINGATKGGTFLVTKQDGTTVELEIIEAVGPTRDNTLSLGSNLMTDRFTINPLLFNSYHTLNWHNCYSFGNGVESNRIKDSFNLPFINNGVKASSTVEKYGEEHRKYGLIYSGLFNSISSVNDLNQFIQAEKITKEVNPIYGSIQKLHVRDSDLIALCEDKILKILANKDAVYNADGNPQLTANQNVLGQTVPFVGEYGISTNPESFVSESYRAYFSDKQRGAIIRLSKDGITPISEHGMKDWFKDNLRLNKQLIGSYDDRNDEYNITLKQSGDTVSFREDVKGWVSFKSFVPENAINCAHQYFTFDNGKLWKHYIEVDDAGNLKDRNTFYGNHTESKVTVILNDVPSSVKTFATLSYEGSQSKVNKYKIDSTTGVDISDIEPYNLEDKLGWYVDSVITDQEVGSLNEFIEKEGKWFNYIKGVNKELDKDSDFGAFDLQGIGNIKDVSNDLGSDLSELRFSHVNTSVQVGDTLYTSTVQEENGVNKMSNVNIKKLGNITKVERGTYHKITFSFLRDNNNNPILAAIDDYVFFVKNKTANTASLVGYYADVTLKNDSKEEVELFAVNSEILESSK